MKLVSWNVNGLRACIKKGFLDYFNKINADIFAVQEIKLQEGQLDLELDGYYQYWNYAIKKGYAGTAVFTKRKPLKVSYDFEEDGAHPEGRLITLEFDDYFFVTIYSPNAQRTLDRLPLRLEWERQLLNYLKELNSKKPVILCGDMNVAHEEIDIRNAKTNHGNSGFTKEERECMTRLLNAGFIDTLRYFYPNEEGLYTWWSYMKTVRERNIGWRIDYFIVSNQLKERLQDSQIDSDIYGSDHCPIVLTLS
ncbi:exodeoxyribonuclease III [Bacillaceae bacterium W0354]